MVTKTRENQRRSFERCNRLLEAYSKEQIGETEDAVTISKFLEIGVWQVHDLRAKLVKAGRLKKQGMGTYKLIISTPLTEEQYKSVSCPNKKTEPVRKTQPILKEPIQIYSTNRPLSASTDQTFAITISGSPETVAAFFSRLRRE